MMTLPHQIEGSTEEITSKGLVRLCQDVTKTVREIVLMNEEIKEEVSQKAEVSLELKNEELIELLLRSVKVTIKKEDGT